MTNMSDHIPRLFCEFDRRDQVSLDAPAVWDQMGLDYPEKDDELVYPRPWDAYDTYSSVILLGPPRSGKTTEFKFQCSRNKNGFILELRDVDFDDSNFISSWSDSELNRWNTFLESDESGELFIDSLDEGRLQTQQAAKKVIKWIRALDKTVRKKLRIHISCRELEWKRLDQSKWEELFPPVEQERNSEKSTAPSHITLALLRLEYSDIQSYMETKAVDGKAFYRVLPKAAENLTRWPQTLRMLVDLFAEAGNFGNIQTIYNQVVEKRIQESNEIRQTGDRVPLRRRLWLAQELAAISILSGREIIALGDVEGVSQIDAGLVDEDLSALREVTGSELFDRYSEGKVRFEDHTLAGFLAAQWALKTIADDGISDATIESLLYTDLLADEVVPKLRIFAGWLSILSSTVRDRLLERSPGILLSNDFPDVLSDNIKLELWAWMKRKYGDREWFNSGVYSDNAHKLVCPEVISDVGVVLQSDSDFGRDLKLFALEILEKGCTKDHDDLLVSLVLDESENLMLRGYTLHALASISPELLPRIKPVLAMPADNDPDLDLIGSALFQLFPDYLSIEEVIEHLGHSKSSHHHGMYQLFVRNVAEKSSPDHRATVLGYLAEKLSKYLDMRKSHQQSTPDWLHTYDPALEFDDFLLPQLKAWGEYPTKFPRLEIWLHLLANANAYGLLSGHSIKEIGEFLDAKDDLRRELIVIRINRLFESKGAAFKPYEIHLHDRLYHSKTEDLEFWKQILVAWANQPMNKLEAAWNELNICWEKAEYSMDVLEWVALQANSFESINELWERNRLCIISDEHLKNRKERVTRRIDKEREKREWYDALKHAIPDIEQGHEGWLNNIVSTIRFEENEEGNIEAWLDSHVGANVSAAFSKGLNAHWANSTPPSISMYGTNQVPWWSNVILMAVERWLVDNGDWNELASEFRQRAIRAALWCCNDVPAWFFDAVRADNVWAKSFFFDVLSIENTAGNELNRLLHLFSSHGEELLVREVVVSFLLSKEQLGLQTLKQSLRLLCENADDSPLDDATLDQLWGETQKYERATEDERFFLFTAAIFRFRQIDIWRMVDNHLSGDDRVGRFQRWLNAIEDIHLRFRFEGKWPAWMNEKSIAAMLPDMFNAFPPPDPSIDDLNNGQMYRGDMGRLRNHGITVLAESGSDFSGKQLSSLLNAPFIPESMHSLILNSIDEWKSRRAQNVWNPLEPENVKRVLSQGLQPVRSAEELFNLVCSVLDEIQDDIENGEEDIRSVFWNGDTPKIETEFQKLIARDFRRSIEVLKNKIVSGRELDVAGNRPDIFATCILPDNQRARIFLEMKRQQFYEKKPGCDASHVISSIRTQLIEKYLADAETKHGIYIVGWYGPEYFGAYKTELKSFNNRVLPNSAEDFEKVLRGIADAEVRKETGIDAIRVFVIDLAKEQPCLMNL